MMAPPCLAVLAVKVLEVTVALAQMAPPKSAALLAVKVLEVTVTVTALMAPPP